MTNESAKRIIEAAELKAEELGLALTIAITDAAGYLTALSRMDGARIIAPQIATAKAFTAAAFRMSSADVATRFADAPWLMQSMTTMTSGQFLPHPGGVAVIDNESLIGAVGISGGSAEQDVAVAVHAITSAGLRAQ